MNNEYLCHKNAIYFILGKEEKYTSQLFENKYVNDLYNSLVKNSKKSYQSIDSKKTITEINHFLDKKRTLAKEFKKATNITWML